MNPLWKKIIGNSSLLLAARVFAKVATIAVMVLMARKLGADEFGVISAILAFTSLSGLVADFGLVLPSIRTISHGDRGADTIMADTFATRLPWALFAIFAMMLLSTIFNFSPWLVLFFTMGSVLEIYATAFIRSFEGKQQMRIVTLFTLVERFTFCLIVITTLYMFGTLQSIAFAYVISNSIMLIFAAVLFKKGFGRFNLQISYSNWKKYTKIGLPFFITALFSTLYYKADTILLSYLKSSNDVGIYNAALRVIDAQMFIPMTMMASIFPVLSNFYHSQDRTFFTVFRRSIFAFIGVGIVVAVTIYAIAPWLILTLYSTMYKDSIIPLQILSVMIVFYFINFLLSQSLIAINLEKTFTIIMIIAAILNIICNLLLIPAYGYMGSAIIRVFIEISITGVFSILLYQKFQTIKRS